MMGRTNAARMAAAALCSAALGGCASVPMQAAQDQAALLLKKDQTVAGTERDSGDCQKKAGLPESEPAQPRTQSDVDLVTEAGRQYALAGWVPVFVQSVGQGIGQGLGATQRERMLPEERKQAEQMAAFQSCMSDRGYIVAHVTTSEYNEVQSKANAGEKEAAMRALYARYAGVKPPGADMAAPDTLPGREHSSSNQAPSK